MDSTFVLTQLHVSEKASKPRVLDVRNSYEWDVGHFEGAARPPLDNFADFEASTYGLPTDPEDRRRTPVMMYCTGGIRCEFFSARLRAQGFEKVYKLKGGIQHYGNTMARSEAEISPARSEGGGGKAEASESLPNAGQPVPHWRGSMFVFDRRNTVRFGAETPEEAAPIGRCEHCGAPTETFVNCGNVDCNRMHLVCSACIADHGGFCSPACSNAPRRRPLDLLAVIYES